MESQEVFDNWRDVGSLGAPYERWTGFTILVFQGYGLPWEEVHSSEDEDGTTEGRPEGDGEPDSSEDQEGEGSGEEGKAGASLEEDKENPTKRKRTPSTWSSFEKENFNQDTKEAAFNYIKVIEELEDTNAEDWHRVRRAGDHLLHAAGGVQRAAMALWIAREQLNMNNLEGVYDPELEGLLHPDHLIPQRYQRSRNAGSLSR